MKCPTCKDSLLIPAKLADGLPGFTCASCEGYLIEILSYRYWSERASPSARNATELELSIPVDSKQALVCPQCSKLMTKYMMSDTTANKVDLCGNCGRFWIDGGEWALVESLNLDTSLTKIFNEPWQKAIRQARIISSHENQLREKLEDDDYQRLVQMREWINGHPLKANILEYLIRFKTG